MVVVWVTRPGYFAGGQGSLRAAGSVLFRVQPRRCGRGAGNLYSCRRRSPAAKGPGTFIVARIFNWLFAVFLRWFLLNFSIINYALVRFHRFFNTSYNASSDILFHLSGNAISTICSVIHAILYHGRNVGDYPLPLSDVLRTTICIIRFFFRYISFFRRVTGLS